MPFVVSLPAAPSRYNITSTNFAKEMVSLGGLPTASTTSQNDFVRSYLLVA